MLALAPQGSGFSTTITTTTTANTTKKPQQQQQQQKQPARRRRSAKIRRARRRRFDFGVTGSSSSSSISRCAFVGHFWPWRLQRHCLPRRRNRKTFPPRLIFFLRRLSFRPQRVDSDSSRFRENRTDGEKKKYAKRLI